MLKYKHRYAEFEPYDEFFRSEEELRSYEALRDKAKVKHAKNLANPNKVVWAKIKGQGEGVFECNTPDVNDPLALLIGRIMGTCFSFGRVGFDALRKIFSGDTQFYGLMLVLNKLKDPVGYCRYKYDARYQGLIVEAAMAKGRYFEAMLQELQEQGHKVKREDLRRDIWATIERGLFRQMEVNNAIGRYPVHRINLSLDSSDSNLFWGVQEKYKEVQEINGVYLDDASYSDQLVLPSPELDLHNEKQARKGQSKVRRLSVLKGAEDVGIKI